MGLPEEKFGKSWFPLFGEVQLLTALVGIII